MDSFLKLWIAIVCVSSKLIIKNKDKGNSVNPIETLKERKNHKTENTKWGSKTECKYMCNHSKYNWIKLLIKGERLSD